MDSEDVQWLDWALPGLLYVLFGVMWVLDGLSRLKARLKRRHWYD